MENPHPLSNYTGSLTSSPSSTLDLTSPPPAVIMRTVDYGEERMRHEIWDFLSRDEGQDIAEYAVMLAVILVLVVGTVRLIGGNANNAFSATASSLSQ